MRLGVVKAVVLAANVKVGVVACARAFSLAATAQMHCQWFNPHS
jgi:hypothetical protein